MKFLLSVFLALLLVVTACNRRDYGRASAAPEDRTANEDPKQQRDDYVKGMEAKLDEFDKKISGLDERASAMKGDAKKDFTNAIDLLRDERKTVKKKLDDVRNVSVGSWTTMKDTVDMAMADLERSYEQVSASHEPTTTGTTQTSGKVRR